jgi:hypothetical protein
MTTHPGESNSSMADLTDYAKLLSDIKTRIQAVQTKAVPAANAAMIRLYWSIGRLLEEREDQASQNPSVVHGADPDFEVRVHGEVHGRSSARPSEHLQPADEIMVKRLRALTWMPEFNVALFALLLNYPWEFLQVPLYEHMPQAPHWEAVKACSRATAGDAVIALAAYGAVAVWLRSRDWVLKPTPAATLSFMGFGVLITVAVEWLALSGLWVERWSYSALMPVVPGLGVGLSPLTQWLVLPPLVLWLVQRQLASRPLQGKRPGTTP